MDSVDDILAHYGVKGMKWGKRKGDSAPTAAVATHTPGAKKLKTSGGKNQGPTDDAVKAAVGYQKAKASGLHSLSNQELRDVVQRMNLERQYNQLKIDKASPGARFVSKVLMDAGKQQVTSLVNDQAKKATKKSS